jgi:hypothetical protein
MFHQLLWIERLKQDAEGKAAKGRRAKKQGTDAAATGFQRLKDDPAPTTFDLITKIPLRDEHVWRLRKMLYMAGGGSRRR